jgi:xanthine dehydrogenase accessory factor
MACYQLLLDADGHLLNGGRRTLLPPLTARGTHVLRDAAGAAGWPILAWRRAHLVLFGAGHVGAAIVRMLGELPCTVTGWTSAKTCSRPAARQRRIEATDMPEAWWPAPPVPAIWS